MKMVPASLVVIVLSFLQCIPTNILFASGGRHPDFSVVVVPVHDGKNDDDADSLVDSVISAMRMGSDIHLVARENVASVLSYHDKPTTPPKLVAAEQLLSKAKEYYYDFRYAEAKSLVKRAISTLGEVPQSVHVVGDAFINAYITSAIIHKSMGEADEARLAFKKALRLNPDYNLDSRAFSPSLVDLFEGVRRKIGELPRGSIRVESSPKACEVYLNGIVKGVTPITIADLPIGVYFLRIGGNKYRPVDKRVGVTGGKTTVVKERLAWSAGRRGKIVGRKSVSEKELEGQVREGVRIAGLMKVDRVILIDVDEEVAGSGVVIARMIDGGHRAGHKPIIVKYSQQGEELSHNLAVMTERLVTQTRLDIAADPVESTEPLGVGEPVLLGRKRSRISKPVVWGLLGGLVAAGIGGGIAAALAGGGGGGAPPGGTGSLSVQFE